MDLESYDRVFVVMLMIVLMIVFVVRVVIIYTITELFGT